MAEGLCLPNSIISNFQHNKGMLEQYDFSFANVDHTLHLIFKTNDSDIFQGYFVQRCRERGVVFFPRGVKLLIGVSGD